MMKKKTVFKQTFLLFIIFLLNVYITSKTHCITFPTTKQIENIAKRLEKYVPKINQETIQNTLTNLNTKLTHPGRRSSFQKQLLNENAKSLEELNKLISTTKNQLKTISNKKGGISSKFLNQVDKLQNIYSQDKITSNLVPSTQKYSYLKDPIESIQQAVIFGLTFKFLANIYTVLTFDGLIKIQNQNIEISNEKQIIQAEMDSLLSIIEKLSIHSNKNFFMDHHEKYDLNNINKNNLKNHSISTNFIKNINYNYNNQLKTFYKQINEVVNGDIRKLKKDFLLIQDNIIFSLKSIQTKIQNKEETILKNRKRMKKNKKTNINDSLRSIGFLAATLIGHQIPVIGPYIAITKFNTIAPIFISISNWGLSFYWKSQINKIENQLRKTEQLKRMIMKQTNRIANLENKFYHYFKQYEQYRNTKQYYFHLVSYHGLYYLYQTLIIGQYLVQNYWAQMILISIAISTIYYCLMKSPQRYNLSKSILNIIIYIFLEIILFIIFKETFQLMNNINEKHVQINMLNKQRSFEKYKAQCEWVNIPTYRQFWIFTTSIFNGFKGVDIDQNGFLIGDYYCDQLQHQMKQSVPVQFLDIPSDYSKAFIKIALSLFGEISLKQLSTISLSIVILLVIRKYII